mgnify:FL=1
MKKSLLLAAIILLLIVIVFIIKVVSFQLAQKPGATKNSETVGIGTLMGNVSIGPLCPVEPCKTPIINNPYSSRQLMLTPKAGTTGSVTYVKLNDDGSFKSDVPTGDYELTLTDCTFLGCSRSLPENITIEANTTTTVNIDIDTGIR